MPKVKIKISQQGVGKLKKQIDEAFADWCAELSVETQSVIEDPNAFNDLGLYDHDIIDTGRLRDSQTVNVETVARRKILRLAWDPISPDTGEHYAKRVYDGFMGYRYYYPGREWPERAVDRIGGFPKFVKLVRKKVK